MKKKYKELLYVKAETQISDGCEQFHFDEAWLMKGFDFDNFVKLLKKGEIKVDIRNWAVFGWKVPHDHGTGFRIFPDKLDLCFSNIKHVV